ncbi:uncharacterized protein L969DRAFT_96502 [Mixia osmundae IAM 14324]|uniref:Adenylate cyclase n=1 Tax=Mixia osmundae (strain CBS 9802 / IAM 14324 / JCM 22182 / KY 12970) TaxID=764103 RepID=G7DUU8_MIXOS|nr:uncharacterized protein L969DRAFT_96502 [Mixia osmundae IAM 14324]KEI37424.1 hypothetical protein L969DRAFT_96502 [Mixia osmundae IAM 14324]GAA94358.1 hypothetical protein E5Q_01009 [Mixia osmundae IAM 14324]
MSLTASRLIQLEWQQRLAASMGSHANSQASPISDRQSAQISPTDELQVETPCEVEHKFLNEDSVTLDYLAELDEFTLVAPAGISLVPISAPNGGRMDSGQARQSRTSLRLGHRRRSSAVIIKSVLVKLKNRLSSRPTSSSHLSMPVPDEELGSPAGPTLTSRLSSQGILRHSRSFSQPVFSAREAGTVKFEMHSHKHRSLNSIIPIDGGPGAAPLSVSTRYSMPDYLSVAPSMLLEGSHAHIEHLHPPERHSSLPISVARRVSHATLTKGLKRAPSQPMISKPLRKASQVDLAPKHPELDLSISPGAQGGCGKTLPTRPLVRGRDPAFPVNRPTITKRRRLSGLPTSARPFAVQPVPSDNVFDHYGIGETEEAREELCIRHHRDFELRAKPAAGDLASRRDGPLPALNLGTLPGALGSDTAQAAMSGSGSSSKVLELMGDGPATPSEIDEASHANFWSGRKASHAKSARDGSPSASRRTSRAQSGSLRPLEANSPSNGDRRTSAFPHLHMSPKRRKPSDNTAMPGGPVDSLRKSMDDGTSPRASFSASMPPKTAPDAIKPFAASPTDSSKLARPAFSLRTESSDKIATFRALKVQHATQQAHGMPLGAPLYSPGDTSAPLPGDLSPRAMDDSWLGRTPGQRSLSIASILSESEASLGTASPNSQQRVSNYPAETPSAGEMKDIVPFLYPEPEELSPTELSRSRHASISQQAIKRPSLMRNGKSSSRLNIEPLDLSGAGAKAHKRGLLAMLRRKSSAKDALHDSFRTAGGSFSSITSGIAPEDQSRRNSPPKLVPRTQELRSKRKSGKERQDSLSVPPNNGMSLDTNLSSMDGIINFDATPRSASRDMDGIPPSRTGSFLDKPYPPGRRRPSTAPSLPAPSEGAAVFTLADTRSRKAPALAGDGIWQAGYGTTFGGIVGKDTPSTQTRRPSYVSSDGNGATDIRRGSTSTMTSVSGVGGVDLASKPGNFVPGAAWTAPESWAVKGDLVPDADSTDSDEIGDDDGEGEEKQDKDQPGDLDASVISLPAASRIATRRGSAISLRGQSSGRVDGSTKRPSTGTSTVFRMPNFTIRVYKADQVHATISAPVSTTAHELQTMIARRPGFVTLKGASYKIFIREHGLERVMAGTERPLLLQRRRLEQAGYADIDRPEDLGREDHSYLCKFSFKAETAFTFEAAEETWEGFQYIDLQARSLSTVPIFLYRHAHEIVSLNLSRNPKIDLPADFVQLCTNLRELRLSNLTIKKLPQSIRECPSLTRLDASNNRIVELDHIQLDEVTELTSLKFHNNRLWSLPAYFSKITGLKYLNISNNKFDTFPPVIASLVSLVDLDVSFNLLTELPESMADLLQLQRLIISGNAIARLPASFAKLVELRELDCRRNILEDLSVLAGMPKLETLRCEHNQITSLSLDSPAMLALEAAHNAITKIALVQMASSLTSINLSHAKLTSLDDIFFRELKSLTALVLDNNQLKTLSESLTELERLASFSCRNNLLEALPESIGNLVHLTHLDVSRNDLSALPSSIWLCPEIVSLTACSNLLTTLPDVPSPVEAEGERKQSVAAGGREKPPMALSLQKLYLADNQLPDGTLAAVATISELRVLNLSFNEIYELKRGSLSKLKLLEELYLSGNELTTLPEEDFARLTDLRILFLNGNKLQTLPAELGEITRLEALDVGNNMLKYNIANWSYDWNWNWNLELRYLNLSGNQRLEIKPADVRAMQAQDGLSAAKRRNLSNFNALRKLRILGLIDVTLTIPVIPDDTEDRRVRTSLSEINQMAYGIADTLGKAHSLGMADLVVPRFRGKEDEALFGLFDGRVHTNTGGCRLAKYLQDCFAASMSFELNKLREGESVEEAMRRTFLNINRDYGNILQPLFDIKRKESGDNAGDRALAVGTSAADVRSGASAVVAYISKKQLVVANVGDALAVISGRSGSARVLSAHHTPMDPAETANIRAAEGWVSPKGLVNDEVEVSRSFGCFHVFPAISVRPAVFTVDLADTDDFVILANRGLWDYMSYQGAVDVARSERADPMLAAQKLRDLAIGYGSNQNIMVMVVSVGDLFKQKKPLSRGIGGAQAAGDDDYQTERRRRGFGNAPGERYLTLLDREVPPPVGTLALVFTDIVNSTSLWETNPGMQMAMRMHNQLLRRQLRAIGGYEVKTEGDAFMVSFPTISAAMLWCFTVQLELLREDWPTSILNSEDGKEVLGANGEMLYRGLSVRMGIHWGQPVCEADPITRRMDYFGPMVNRSARIGAVADGGQIVASADAIELIKAMIDPSDLIDARNGSEEDGDWQSNLDEKSQRDILAIRKMGFGITELGDRRLKGLETPEFLSLIYPKELANRIKSVSAGQLGASSKPAEIYDPIPQIIDVNHVRQLAFICLRLEALSAGNAPEAQTAFMSLPVGASPLVGVNSRDHFHYKTRVHPHLLTYPTRADATDEELLAVVESLLVRIENVLATYTLRQLGPYADVLSVLSELTRQDPKYVLHALSLFAQTA